MIKLIALDERLVSTVADLVADERGDIEDGSTAYVDKSEALADMDEILSALRTAEDAPLPYEPGGLPQGVARWGRQDPL